MGTEDRTKIKRSFVKNEVYVRLRDWIVEGTLKPGEVIRDLELAKQLGVSRTPVREALLKLADENFVEMKPNRSTKVKEIRFEEAYSLYSIIWTLEKLALVQGSKHLEKVQIEKMMTYNKKLGQAIKNNEAVKANTYDSAFHDVIIHSSQNYQLIKILTGLKQNLKRIELFYFTKIDHLITSCEEHDKIIMYIIQKDESQACSMIEQNWKNGWYNIENYMNKKKPNEGELVK